MIDDEDRIRRLLRTALEMEGHQVLEARQGNEGLEVIRTTAPDLVITDLMMPDKDGLEVLLALKREAPELKVIAMSGGGKLKMMEPLLVAEPLGAFAAVRKPFDLDVMLETVKRALAA
ncbi:MAG TPA: response regulator [Candidatus Eisenbacteria bacterium]